MDTNADVVFEILLHLPAKLVLRFRSVCKFWCNIIDSPAFRKFHFHINQSKNNDADDVILLQFSFRDQYRECELSTVLPQHNWKSVGGFSSFQEFKNVKDNNIPIKIAGSINGLICIYGVYPHMRIKKSSPIAICNPCLGEMTILPLSPLCSSLLAYEPPTEVFCFREVGFGFDHITKEYKIVQVIRQYFFNMGTSVEVYSGTTNTWKNIDNHIFDKEVGDFRGLREIKSTSKKIGSWVHWQADGVILSFHVHTEVFETILLPITMHVYEKKYEVFAKDDDLCFLYVVSGNFSGMQLWEHDKERGWTHVRNVNIQLIGERLLPKAFWKDGVILSRYCLLEKEIKDLIFYDYCNIKRTRIELPIDRCGYDMMELLEYKCSLNSLVNCMSIRENT